MSNLAYPAPCDAAPPGSIEAIESGCTCQIEENNFGLGRILSSGAITYIVNSQCPVHGSSSDREAEAEAEQGNVEPETDIICHPPAITTERRPKSVIQVWPEQMSAEIAAAYCGEKSVAAFRRSTGKLYPEGRRIPGKGLRWLRSELEAAIHRLHDAPLELRDECGIEADGAQAEREETAVSG